MKHYFSLALLLLWAAVGTASQAQAQEYDWREHRHSMSFTAGTPSAVSGTAGFFTMLFSGFDQNADHQFHYTGTYGVHYRYNVLKWLRVGGDLSYSGYREVENGSSYTKTTLGNELALAAKLDFTYLNREHVKLYSGLGIGPAMLINATQSESDNTRDVSPLFTWCVTPIGVEAGGERVYALAEFNIGFCDFLRAGIGFRF